MTMEDAAWARPEELKKTEEEAIKRAQAGELSSENDYSAYYAYKTGANRDLIKHHAVSEDVLASEYVTNVNALMGMLGVGFRGNVMDLGCAIGIIPEHIRNVSGVEKVTGIDISETGVDVARRDYPKCYFLCQPADELSNITGDSIDVIHGREFYPFTRTNDLDFQINCLKGYLSKLKPGGAVVLSMVCLSKGICTNWIAARSRLLNEGYSVVERRVLIHDAIFRRLGKVCYKQSLNGFLVMMQGMISFALGKKQRYVYIMVR
ncbi:class I SAM-dependent methyltransferase [Candidatus Ferrigenium straubiae]|uniref:class I SAM-dependent methyltransferase n=1 Tax=Candidatus Ferrigenium straubiae TaxID=2919506 RepID=UPI003F4A961B